MMPRSSWRLGRAVLAVPLLATLVPRGAASQQPGLSGYYLNVFTGVAESLLAPAGVTDFQRLRLMWRGSAGPVRLDAAYEHSLTLRQEGALGAQLFTAAGTASGGDWLSLGGEIESSTQLLWRHRVDRLSARIDLGSSADLVIGRQPVSWATTLILTPADPFSPFDPADPFREYRTGVDAVRLRYYRGSFTQFEVMARPARQGDRETLTMLGRVSSNRGGWDLGAWGGVVHDTFGAAAFLSGSVGLWALRAEGAVRDLEDRLVVRGTVGLDRTFPLTGRDLYVVVEYQRDDLGATSPDGLLDAARSRAFEQGEMQVLGRDVGALQLSYPLHPLVSVSSLVLGSLRDGSFIFAPGLTYSASESLGLSAGAFFGFGEGPSLDGLDLSLGSEFGALPRVGYLSATVFFW
ncbi:MAG: hypothetical protein OXN18_04770 [Gemmatimonadota bacterium]|nr:hypothetical protein [Gemmatimonadota bacterium]